MQAQPSSGSWEANGKALVGKQRAKPHPAVGRAEKLSLCPTELLSVGHGWDHRAGGSLLAWGCRTQWRAGGLAAVRSPPFPRLLERVGLPDSGLPAGDLWGRLFWNLPSSREKTEKLWPEYCISQVRACRIPLREDKVLRHSASRPTCPVTPR